MRFAIVVVLLSIGCSAKQIDLPGKASIDPSFTPAQTETILQAFENWRLATNDVATLDVSVGTGGELHVSPATLDAHQTEGLTTIAPDGTASLQLDLTTIETAAQMYKHSVDEMLLDTAMHEIGHAFGLEHVPGTLMRAAGYGGAKVDPDTLKRFCADYSCPDSLMRTPMGGTHSERPL